MIKKPEELNFSEKKLVVIVAGVPGIGKTTLALSSPNPLLIDLDNGISRVEPRYRKDVDVVSSYEELIEDLNSADLSVYESIVIDTGGKLLDFLKPVVIKEDAKNGKRDGNLSLQGYGAVKRKFSQFINLVKSKNKHLIIVFHATEVALANDTTGLRIRIEGSTKDEVWDDVDLGGFVEMVGNKRTIGFSNCDRYYAKGTHGIHGTYEIPTLAEGDSNTFLTDLFTQVLNDLNNQSKELGEYNKLIASVKPEIEALATLDDVNNYIEKLGTLNHVLTSKKELWFALSEKAKSLGAKYDKEAKSFK